MSLIEQIQKLNTSPRRQEEEYEHTSDFLEWFYYNIYRNQGFEVHPVLKSVSEDSEYECIKELCKNLINVNYTKDLDNEKLTSSHENMKKWTIETIKKVQPINQ